LVRETASEHGASCASFIMSHSQAIAWSDRAWKLNPATRLMDFIAIRLVSAGFQLLDQDRVVETVDVQHVTRLIAYKLDLLTSDCICLRIERRNEDEVTVHEEMPGFSELFTVLAVSFPGLDREWYFKVMSPAFRRNETTIWRAQ
jgi:hypothetical protein